MNHKLPPLPERDTSKPTEQQGVFRKFYVCRTDGSDKPGGKHHGCEYFVLDVDHDPIARAALKAYADAVEATRQKLAADMRERYAIAAIEAQGVPEELRKEAMNLASILSGMVEGGYSDLETLYTEDQADGDAFVKRAAEVLDLLASAPPAPQADMRIPDAVEHYGGVKSDEELFPTQASVVQQEPVTSAMTAHRAAYFMERFKHEEKLLGPNEQAALDFVLSVLYTHPAQQAKPQPLSDEQLAEIAMASGAYDEQLIAFARAIEAAHGITKG